MLPTIVTHEMKNGSVIVATNDIEGDDKVKEAVKEALAEKTFYTVNYTSKVKDENGKEDDSLGAIEITKYDNGFTELDSEELQTNGKTAYVAKAGDKIRINVKVNKTATSEDKSETVEGEAVVTTEETDTEIITTTTTQVTKRTWTETTSYVIDMDNTKITDTLGYDATVKLIKETSEDGEVTWSLEVTPIGGVDIDVEAIIKAVTEENNLKEITENVVKVEKKAKEIEPEKEDPEKEEPEKEDPEKEDPKPEEPPQEEPEKEDPQKEEPPVVVPPAEEGYQAGDETGHEGRSHGRGSYTDTRDEHIGGSSGLRDRTAAITAGTDGHWILLDEAAHKWVVELNAGSRIAGRWAYLVNPYAHDGQVKEGWFLFGADTIMLTGWYNDPSTDKWYYLHEISDGTLGTMETGWIFNGGEYYWTDPKDGHMQTGWAEIGGKQYYLKADNRGNRPGSLLAGTRPYGAMYRNQNTPDDAWVGDDGSRAN